MRPDPPSNHSQEPVARAAHDCSELQRYMVSTEAERDWVLSAAVGYFMDLELTRTPSQRLSATTRPIQDALWLRPIMRRSAKKLLTRCILEASQEEDPAVELGPAKTAGFQSHDELLYLAAMQYIFYVRTAARRLAKSGNASEDLWRLYKDFMYFCHSRAFELQGVYEERVRRERIDRNTKRDPRESYDEWRRRASPLRAELHPESLLFVRSTTSTVAWREDRSDFHRKWVGEQVSGAWMSGYRPYKW